MENPFELLDQRLSNIEEKLDRLEIPVKVNMHQILNQKE
jgi:hypothetical protein